MGNPANPAGMRDIYIRVHFFQFKKKNNSTAQARPWQPTDNPAEQFAGTYNCFLIEPCSILSPVIALNLNYGVGDNEGEPAPNLLNYAYIQNWERYYFIRDWVFSEGRWIVYMEIDALASWRDAIGDTKQYILRSTRTSLQNGYIKDATYPTLGLPTQKVTVADNGQVDDLSMGYYVLGVISGTTDSVGGIEYLVLTPAQMKLFYSILLTETDWFMDVPNEQLTEITPGLAKALFNPMQYVVSIKWYPFRPPTIEGQLTITLGWWRLQFTAAGGGIVHRMSQSGRYRTHGSIAVPKHPQAATRGSFLNSAPYSSYQLDARPFGFIPLDATLLQTTDTLWWSTQVDCFTGDATFRLATSLDDARCIYVMSGNLSVDFSISQIARIADASTINTISAVNSDTSSRGWTVGVSGAKTYSDNVGVNVGANFERGKGGLGMGDIGGGVSGNAGISTQVGINGNYNIGGQSQDMTSQGSVTSTTSSILPQCSIKGAVGSIAGINTYYALTGTFYPIADEDTSRGRPVYKEAVIKEGADNVFIQCYNVELEFPAFAEEKAMIAQAMEAGFWWERGWTN